MKAIDALLRLHPLRALKEMMVERMHRVANTDWFMVSAIVGNRDTYRAKVLLEINNLYAPADVSATVTDPVIVYVDKIPLSRLNVGGTVHLPLNRYGLNLPLFELMEHRFKEAGLRFEGNDFANQNVAVGDTVVEAGDLSTRWYGDLNVNVTLATDSVEDYVNNRTLTLPFDTDSSLTNLPQMLTTVINAENLSTLPVLITPGDFTIIPESLVRIGNDAEAINSRLTLHFLMAYDGDLTIEYGRRTFPHTYANNLIIVDEGDMTTGEMLTVINQMLRASIEIDELINFTVPDIPKWSSTKFYIRFKETSLLHSGEIWIEYRKGVFV